MEGDREPAIKVPFLLRVNPSAEKGAGEGAGQGTAIPGREDRTTRMMITAVSVIGHRIMGREV